MQALDIIQAEHRGMWRVASALDALGATLTQPQHTQASAASIASLLDYIDSYVDTVTGISQTTVPQFGGTYEIYVGFAGNTAYNSVATFDRWLRPDRIRELARLAVLTRGAEEKSKLPPGATVVTARRVDVSSSEIRRRVAGGKSIKGFVADRVEQFILAAQLYTS